MGDAKKAVKKVTKAVKNVATTPLRIAKTVVKGGSLKDVAKEAVKGVASGATLTPIGAATNVVTSSSKLTKGLNDPIVNKLSFGLARDFSGSAYGLQSLASRGSQTKAQFNSMTRFGAKVGAISAAGAFAPKLLVAKNYGAAQLIKSSVDKGDILGAAVAAGGVEGGPSIPVPGFIDDIRNNDFIKDTWGNIKGLLNSPSAPPSNSAGAPAYAQAGGISGGSFGQAAAIIVVVTAVGMIFFRRK